MSGLAGAPSGVEANQPSVAYDPELDRYAVVFVRQLDFFGVEVQMQQVSGAGQPILNDGTPGPQARLVSLAGNAAKDPDVAYRPDTSGDGNPGDRWIVAYVASTTTTPNESAVFASALDPLSFAGQSLHDAVSDLPAGRAEDPSVVAIPGVDDVAVVFEGTTGIHTEVFASGCRRGSSARGRARRA